MASFRSREHVRVLDHYEVSYSTLGFMTPALPYASYPPQLHHV